MPLLQAYRSSVHEDVPLQVSSYFIQQLTSVQHTLLQQILLQNKFRHAPISLL